MSLNITDVQYTPSTAQGTVLGNIAVTLNGVLTIGDFRLINGSKGEFVAGPSRPKGKGQDGFINILSFPDRDAEVAFMKDVQARVKAATGGKASPARSRIPEEHRQAMAAAPAEDNPWEA